MSLTTCLKKMGAAISPKDKAAILSLARGYRSQGLDPTAAAIQAVSDQAEIAQSRLAELSTADRQVESTPLPSKRVADTPQTETENFKRWFGDSKVVDAQGKPLVVYHGTERDFDAFKVGSALGWGRGIYFTDNQEYTREFGDRTVAPM
jgi:replication initiation and membrane attachment protein DnaB